ncbi:MAG: pilus assembly protein PilB [Cyanobacteria bacterium P01_D01_bin.50]
MLSSRGKPIDTSTAIENQKPSKTTENGDSSFLNSKQKLEREQIFQLIESILCFEACLYHQVIPLKLEDKNLLLGIVNPQDREALDYVNSILSYLNCAVETQLVPADTHRTILSEYLNYKNTSEVSKLCLEEAKIDSTNTRTKSISSTQDLEEESQPGDNTLILFDSESGGNLENISPITQNKIFSVNTPLNEEDFDKDTEAEMFEIVSGENSPVLKLPLRESCNSIEQLSTLTPKKLLKELLARVLAGGIGRLYLERQPYQGKILWSLNGIVQSVIEELPLSTFQGVMNELKRLNSLPAITLTQAKQVETECLYQQQRLLLRLRVMPGTHGEEATLQVLRGAALKFYQQQQLSRLSDDVLGASQKLSYKVKELQQKLALNMRDFTPRQLEALNSLNELVENLDVHLRVLRDISKV